MRCARSSSFGAAVLLARAPQCVGRELGAGGAKRRELARRSLDMNGTEVELLDECAEVEIRRPRLCRDQCLLPQLGLMRRAGLGKRDRQRLALARPANRARYDDKGAQAIDLADELGSLFDADRL